MLGTMMDVSYWGGNMIGNFVWFFFFLFFKMGTSTTRKKKLELKFEINGEEIYLEKIIYIGQEFVSWYLS